MQSDEVYDLLLSVFWYIPPTEVVSLGLFADNRSQWPFFNEFVYKVEAQSSHRECHLEVKIKSWVK